MQIICALNVPISILHIHIAQSLKSFYYYLMHKSNQLIQLKQDRKVNHLSRTRARYTLVLHNIRGGLGGRAAWLRRQEIRGPSHLHLAVRVVA